MVETCIPSLETLRVKESPLYWVGSDPALLKYVRETLWNGNHPFGCEIGCGYDPAKVYLIDPSVPWIITDAKPAAMNAVRGIIDMKWTQPLPSHSFTAYATTWRLTYKDIDRPNILCIVIQITKFIQAAALPLFLQ